MNGVHTSGTDVLHLVTSPGNVSFNIIDDAVALEAPEMYSLTLLPIDSSVMVRESVTNIVITNNIDSMYYTYGAMTIFCTCGGSTLTVIIKIIITK